MKPEPIYFSIAHFTGLVHALGSSFCNAYLLPYQIMSREASFLIPAKTSVKRSIVHGKYGGAGRWLLFGKKPLPMLSGNTHH